jgi:ligand-binding SRPBCC domain-containing protein
MSTAEISITSRVDATPERLWERITTPEGINHEMRPWMRMTLPRGVSELSVDQVELGKPIGRCWILLFGVLPIDFDEVNLVRLEPGRGFLERSRMLSQRSWEHERTIEPDGEGSLVTDRVRWQPRLGLPARALRPMFRAFFRHRHRRLQDHFAGESRSPEP